MQSVQLALLQAISPHTRPLSQMPLAMESSYAVSRIQRFYIPVEHNFQLQMETKYLPLAHGGSTDIRSMTLESMSTFVLLIGQFELPIMNGI